MRRIERTAQFKRDYKQVSRGQDRTTLDNILKNVLVGLVSDQPLSQRHRDHALKGNLSSYRECHIKPDLILIYKKVDEEVLRLARLGSHSELKL